MFLRGRVRLYGPNMDIVFKGSSPWHYGMYFNSLIKKGLDVLVWGWDSWDLT